MSSCRCVAITESTPLGCSTGLWAGPGRGRAPGGGPRYPEAVIDVLAQVWAASGYLCAVRLKAALPTWLPWLRRRVALTPALERQLLAISPRQVERRLRSRKQTLKRTLYGTTRPGSLLKSMIPIKTDQWDVTKAGYLEIDLVSHSGASGTGEFCYTLDAVDIQTSWVERQAVLGKGRHQILAAVRAIEARLPFTLRGIDSDNGSEFINDHLWAFCQRPGRAIQFTRSRPYKTEALAALNALYTDLRLFQNLFQPSMKLRRKIRHGSRLRRQYDAPQTPWARVLASPEADPATVAALQRVVARTDPFALSQRIDQQLARVWALAHRGSQPPRAPVPHPPQPRHGLAWRGWTFSPTLQRAKDAQLQQQRRPR